MKRALFILLASLAGFAALNGAIFHTGLYVYWLDPASAAGYVGTVLYHERIRPKAGPNQILGIGDSRMGLVAKTANALTNETGYEFGNVAVPGTTPRCWYYMLRDIDPTASAYRAIVIGMESYNDDEMFEDYADRESDLNYVIHQLRVTDLVEFSGSYHAPHRQWRAARGIAFKAVVYQQDILDFLEDPAERVDTVEQNWRDSFGWYYGFRTDEKTLEQVRVDWERRAVSGAPAGMETALRRQFVDPLPQDKGRHSAYLKYWLGRIRDLYKSSPTKLVFVRLPRTAWIRPDLPPANPRSSVHMLEQEPNVVALPERLFDELETPAMFHDQVHMNQIGLDRFTEKLARTLREVVGPPL